MDPTRTFGPKMSHSPPRHGRTGGRRDPWWAMTLKASQAGRASRGSCGQSATTVSAQSAQAPTMSAKSMRKGPVRATTAARSGNGPSPAR
jgi:hypothetical protein